LFCRPGPGETGVVVKTRHSHALGQTRPELPVRQRTTPQKALFFQDFLHRQAKKRWKSRALVGFGWKNT